VSSRFYLVRVVDLSRNATVFKPRLSRADVSIVMLHRIALAAALLTGPSVSSAMPSDPPTGGCTCPTGAAQLLEQTDHIFIGDLTEVKGSGEDAGVAVIRVRENLKGQLTGVVDVRDVLATKCSWSVFEMASPGRYVVFANLDEGELVTPAFCPQTQPLSGWKDRLAPFRAYARAHKPAPAAAAPGTTNAGTSSTPGRPGTSPKAGS
jgi:hypothetical protein